MTTEICAGELRASQPATAGRRAVVLFARPPRQEARLKRLASAARLFELARDRAVEAVSALPGVELVVVGQAGAGCLLPPGSSVLPQRGRIFAERLESSFHDVGALGFESIVAVGIDSPSLQSEHLELAFRALDTHDAVLGPSADGGVYLVGVRGALGSFFRGVHWQTGDVLRELLGNRPGAATLPAMLVDVDRLANLWELLASTGLDPELAQAAARAIEAPPITPWAENAPRVVASPCQPISPRGPPAVELAVAV